MFHPIYQIVSYAIVGPYTLSVTFDDDTSQHINFEPILAGELYGPLRDLSVFNQVMLDPESHTLVWPNGADFDPETLHDWPQSVKTLQKVVRQWEKNDKDSYAAAQVKQTNTMTHEEKLRFWNSTTGADLTALRQAKAEEANAPTYSLEQVEAMLSGASA